MGAGGGMPSVTSGGFMARMREKVRLDRIYQAEKLAGKLDSGKFSKFAAKARQIGGKIFGKAFGALALIMFAKEMIQAYSQWSSVPKGPLREDNWPMGGSPADEQYRHELGRISATWGTALVGGALGSFWGAVMGTAIPLPFIGSGIGGFVGGLAGGLGGFYFADKVYDWLSGGPGLSEDMIAELETSRGKAAERSKAAKSFESEKSFLKGGLWGRVAELSGSGIGLSGEEIKARQDEVIKIKRRIFKLDRFKYVAGGVSLEEQKQALALLAGAGPLDTAGATVLVTNIMDNSQKQSAVTNAQTSTFIDNANLPDLNSNGNGGARMGAG